MPDFDDLQFNKPEDEIDYSNLSLDELLESAKEELARDDAHWVAERDAVVASDVVPLRRA